MSLRSFAEVMLPLYAQGGIVFGVGFGGVSNGVGADRIECTWTTPVTYYRGLSGSTLDAVRRSRYD
jgi:hypothetical protein